MPSTREHVFTTVGLSFGLVAGQTGVSSQQSQDLTDALATKLAITPGKMTAMRAWVNGLYVTSTAVTTPVIGEYTLGIGVFTQEIDNGDFPNLELHDGPWMLHDARRLVDRNAGVLLEGLEPANTVGGSCLQLTTRSARKLERVRDRLFMVVQKDRATEETVTLSCSVTVMWLLP